MWYRDLSGDIVVEQNIHVLDMCNWFLRAHPVKAVATCARKMRQDAGDCKDNFNAVVTYPGDVQITFGSTQFDSPEFDAGVRLFGSEGSSESHYDWRVKIAGTARVGRGSGRGRCRQRRAVLRRRAAFRGALDEADAEKQKAFVASITGKHLPQSGTAGRRVGADAMLIRNAAYAGTPMTWDELLASTEVYDPKFNLARMS